MATDCGVDEPRDAARARRPRGSMRTLESTSLALGCAAFSQAVCYREEGREKAREKRNVFSLDLNTVTESLLTTVFGTAFQTAGEEHR